VCGFGFLRPNFFPRDLVYFGVFHLCFLCLL
jgi:hypothetical protein